MRFPLLIPLLPSRRLRAAYAFLVLLALLSVLVLPHARVPWGLKIAGCMLILLVAWQTRPQLHGLQRLRIETDGRVSSDCSGCGEPRALQLGRVLWSGQWLLVVTIRFEDQPGLRILSVAADGSDPDAFRRLRIWLAYRKLHKPHKPLNAA